MSSKLPNEIKRLMIEHPIQQQSPMNPASSVLSDELIQKASRLMNNNVANNVSHFDNNQSIDHYIYSYRLILHNPLIVKYSPTYRYLQEFFFQIKTKG
jgi:hypothetical protein